VKRDQRTGLNDERELTEPYAVRKARKAAEKARLDRMNPLERMTDAYLGDDLNKYDANVVAAHEAHRQYTMWQFQQFQCGHRAGMTLPEIAEYMKIGYGACKHFRVWLDLPKRSGRKPRNNVMIKLDTKVPPDMYNAAKSRAAQLHLTFPVYVRRLIEADLAGAGKPP
jgi:hypothetical protein